MTISNSKPESNKPEDIRCSAISYLEHIICGYRHSDCIEIAINLIDKNITRDNCICGFLTSKNRFVTRNEAFKIAQERKQIWHKIHDGVKENILVSEDLY